MPTNASPAWGLDRRAWLALLAAWLGWGFDVFDALLFNFVAPNCIPTLLGLEIGSPEARAATAKWTGILTALLLVGWAIGGILFGHLSDRIGRARALMLTISLYAVGTAACAFATSIEMLIAFRAIASLGIGGEWAAGATLVAETVPDEKRLPAGALMQSASPFGLFLATFVTWLIAGVLMPDRPDLSWRVVFLCGMLPVLAVLLIRFFVLEPGNWKPPAERLGVVASVRRLFAPGLRPATLSGLGMAIIALITWWSCNAFLPSVGGGLGQAHAAANGITGAAAVSLAESWKASAATWFNVGGLLGSFLTVPVARRLGRRGLFATYFAGSAVALLVTFLPDWPPEVRLRLTFFVGLTIYGIFGAFSYYLPELFPGALRGLGAGLTYNTGRLIAAAGPFVVGAYSAAQADPVQGAIVALTFIAALPLVGVALSPLIVETRHRRLDATS